MASNLTFRESRVLRSARDALDLCDVARAKRTEPTKAQTESALTHWRGPSVLERMAHLFRRQA